MSYAWMDEKIEALQRDLEWAYEQFTMIRDVHMSCEQPTEQEEREVHKMFHYAEEGIQKMKAYRKK